MLKCFIVLAFLSAAGQSLFTNVIDGNSILTGVVNTTHYALADAELRRHDIASAYVNGGWISFVNKLNCEVDVKLFRDLRPDEKQFIDQIADGLMEQNSANRLSVGGVGEFLFTGNTTGLTGVSSIGQGDVSVQRIGDFHYAVRTPKLTDEFISRVIVNNDLVTFILFDGHIQMKPRSCLNAQEQQLLDGLQLDMDQAQVEWETEFHERQAQLERERLEQAAIRERQLQEQEAAREARQIELGRQRLERQRERETQQLERLQRQQERLQRQLEARQARLESRRIFPQ